MQGTEMCFRQWIKVIGVISALLATPLLAAEKLVVYTVNYPLQYFTQRIAGDHAEVVFPLPSDTDPAFWQPEAESIAGFQRADLILLNGAGYARWVKRVSLPRRKLVDTASGFGADFIETRGELTHSHGREGDHSHTGTAFTTWLDFSQAAMQANAVRDALSQFRPELADVFADNALDLERDLLGLDARLEAIVATHPARPLIASHPVYQYLSRRYGINLKSLMWEPDTVPAEDQWREFERVLTEHPAEWMVWESNPVAESVERLQQLGVKSTVFNPCANLPEEGDFLTVMSSNVINLERVFQ